MGQKTHPYGFRLGFNKDWKSRWFAEGKDYVDKLHEDLKLRRYIKKTHENAGIQDVIIERVADSITLYIYTARPGVIIGRGGSKLQEIRTNIQKDFNKQEVAIEIKEVSKPELSAQLTAEGVAVRLEKRTAFRRAMRMAVAGALKCGFLDPLLPLAPHRCSARGLQDRRAQTGDHQEGERDSAAPGPQARAHASGKG